MNKLSTDTPSNINQVTSDVIILYNDDGTKVIMVLENGRWLQARTGTYGDSLSPELIHELTKKKEIEIPTKQPNKKTFKIDSQKTIEQPHPKAYKKDASPAWYIDIEDAQDLSTIGGEHYVIVKDDYIVIRDDKRFDGER